jgi:hypothetical protein
MLVVEKGPAYVFGLLGGCKNGRNYHGTIIRARSKRLQRGVVPGGFRLTSVVYAQRNAREEESTDLGQAVRRYARAYRTGGARALRVPTKQPKWPKTCFADPHSKVIEVSKDTDFITA